ncbi:papain-like cysteine protease family protein [uncultured Draconibacterium sp.]|uniref:papain-like cysteine protease family protein n=1 Tax=uncultured Draconibacterium sp. TaxID=1573823 RepID=UPI003216391B
MIIFSFNEFKKQIRKDNWKFVLKKSELNGLYNFLKTSDRPNPNRVAMEMGKVSSIKWQKYKKTRHYLTSSIPGLTAALATSGTTLGQTPTGYVAGKWYKRKDRDGRWFEILLQGKDNSCGPACVLIIKQLIHPNAKYQLREPQIRGLIAQAEHDTLHTGSSSIGSETIALHDWRHVGSCNPPLMTILKGNPFPIRNVRYASSSKKRLFEQLNACSTKKPAIVGWAWAAGGGHWTVCIGPTRDQQYLIILDPWNGIKYVQNDETNFTKYQSTGKLEFTYQPLSPVLTC